MLSSHFSLSLFLSHSLSSFLSLFPPFDVRLLSTLYLLCWLQSLLCLCEASHASLFPALMRSHLFHLEGASLHLAAHVDLLPSEAGYCVSEVEPHLCALLVMTWCRRTEDIQMVFSHKDSRSHWIKWIKKTSVPRKEVSPMSRFLEVSICKAAAYWRQLFFFFFFPQMLVSWHCICMKQRSVPLRCNLLKLVHAIRWYGEICGLWESPQSRLYGRGGFSAMFGLKQRP